MKRFSLPVLAAAALAAQLFGQPPASVHQVYVMPMSGGLDQYLAEWLTRNHVLQVVTDPKIADAVLTDRLGDAFEQRLSEIRPPEPPAAGKDSAAAKKEDTAGAGNVTGPHIFHSGFAQGTMFLVDARTRQVLWSDYEKPRGTSDRNLNREAEKFVRKLQGKAPAASN